jgi:hypothetical protein
LSGTPPDVVTVEVRDLPMSRADPPPPADQFGSDATLDSGDFRISDAVYSAGRIWLGFNEACRPAGDTATRACVRLVELDTAAGTILQSFDLAVAGKHVFYPALRVDRHEDLAVIVAYSSESDYPGLLVTGRVYDDAAGVLQSPRVVALGSGPEDPSSLCSSVCRYGDYFGAALDPSDSTTIWLAGQVGTPSGWSTRVLGATIKAMLSLDYTVQGGDPGTGPPVLTYVLNGTTVQEALTSSPTAYLADPGTAWVVSEVLPASTETERWFTRGRNGIPPEPGFANRSVTETFVYFHQYNVTFSSAILRGGTPASLRVAVISMGLQVWLPSNEDHWVDAGFAYAFENPLEGSSTTERWYAPGSVGGIVNGPGAISVAYYHQYLATFDYRVPAGSAYDAPTIAAIQFGSNGTVAPLTPVWVDVGSAYVYSASLPGPTETMRFAAGSNAVGTIEAPSTITVLYRVQYYVAVGATPAGAAPLLSGGGWYDVGAMAILSVASDVSFAFQGWSGTGDGSYTGSEARTSVTVHGPIAELARFYPALTVVAGNGGSVSYAYGVVSGAVPSGGSATIYVPPGTTVRLTASPDSWANAFNGWSGGAGGGATTTSVSVDGPAVVMAAFGPNPSLIAVLAVLPVAAALLVVLWARRRRRPRSP